MRQSNSLRFRVALVFALFGALLSVLFSGGIYFTAHELGHRLMDETLRAELEDSVERHARDSVFVAPNTVSIKGYVLSETELALNIPSEIKSLSPGRHEVNLGEVDYRVLVADRNGVRYFMLFDADSQNKREVKFIRFLFLFALFMTVASAAGGLWLAVRILTPVTRLVGQVARAEPGDSMSLAKLTRNDEVGELARAFDHYLHRMQEFIERENYFTADVSHELRTSLAIILGALEVLEQDKTLSVKQKERVARIRRAAQDMIDMSEALLLLAHEYRPLAGQQPCKAGEVVSACICKHQHLIGDRPIRIEVELNAEQLLLVERPLLEIVIDNVLRNALFNTQSGTVLFRLEAGQLIVKDSGVGMSPEVLERALEHHFKGASSAGAGVGLSLVKRICDRYGWHISIDSQQGHGTTVEIDFTPRK
ncbi:MAG: HAMP domain-containing sensor histidine kinase [Gallionellaceae bacterium]|jgi:signal transduction histidine kinase